MQIDSECTTRTTQVSQPTPHQLPYRKGRDAPIDSGKCSDCMRRLFGPSVTRCEDCMLTQDADPEAAMTNGINSVGAEISLVARTLIVDELRRGR